MEKYIKDTLLDLLQTPSPTGYTKEIIRKIGDYVTVLGYEYNLSPKGNLLVEVDAGSDYNIGYGAHVDTLGVMVRAIKENGFLSITLLGGYTSHAIEGEYVKIHCRNGKVYTGTILNTEPSVHVYKNASTQERIPENMEIRIDEVVKNKEDVEKLGIMAGDFVSLESRAEWTESGYIKSRHLDDKAGVISILALLKEIKEKKLKLRANLKFLISTFEEVGHGSSAIPWALDEFIAIDMGSMGSDLTCTEQQVSICAKDSSGPYHYDVVDGLVKVAQKNNIDFAIDIYPFYGSDASAALRGGNDFKAGLIGPGVHASHHMERTHYDGIMQTIELMKGYVIAE